MAIPFTTSGGFWKRTSPIAAGGVPPMTSGSTFDAAAVAEAVAGFAVRRVDRDEAQVVRGHQQPVPALRVRGRLVVFEVRDAAAVSERGALQALGIVAVA